MTCATVPYSDNAAYQQTKDTYQHVIYLSEQSESLVNPIF